jgi:transposase-like protein
MTTSSALQLPITSFCPKCGLANAKAQRHGSFFSKHSGPIPRWKCVQCKKTFSLATHSLCFKQHRRDMNFVIFRDLTSGISQNRLAINLGLNRKTIVRKFLFLGTLAKMLFEEGNAQLPKVKEIEFDDLESFEHTKCKPLSVTLAVEFRTRRILGFQVSQMPAKGLLAAISRKKYGLRPDHRSMGREKLFTQIKDLLTPNAKIKSDQNPHYPRDVKNHFPDCAHETLKGRRGCVTGQGELKRGGFDPLFSLNHTCAKMRSDINRLIRRTWRTTKKPKRLELHIAMFTLRHNFELLKKQKKKSAQKAA